MGVYNKKWLVPLAETLKQLGSERAMLVCGSDGLDEITTTGKTFITELNDQEIYSYELNPEDYNIKISSQADLIGGLPNDNAEKIIKLLDGEEGPFRDIVIINAAAAIYISGEAINIEEGIELANQSLNSGKAKTSLKKLIKVSNEE